MASALPSWLRLRYYLLIYSEEGGTCVEYCMGDAEFFGHRLSNPCREQCLQQVISVANEQLGVTDFRPATADEARRFLTANNDGAPAAALERTTE